MFVNIFIWKKVVVVLSVLENIFHKCTVGSVGSHFPQNGLSRLSCGQLFLFQPRITVFVPPKWNCTWTYISLVHTILHLFQFNSCYYLSHGLDAASMQHLSHQHGQSHQPPTGRMTAGIGLKIWWRAWDDPWEGAAQIQPYRDTIPYSQPCTQTHTFFGDTRIDTVHPLTLSIHTIYSQVQVMITQKPTSPFRDGDGETAQGLPVAKQPTSPDLLLVSSLHSNG